MINFYMTPGSCSTGIHILLEELELVFSANLINLLEGDQFKPEFVAINPKSTIPVLVLDDGTALTSFLSIAWWLALKYPQAGLLPNDAVEQARAMDVMSYAVNHIHGSGYTRIFTPEHYSSGQQLSESDRRQLHQQGEAIVCRGFEYLATILPEGGYYLEQQFTIVDAALFYIEFWADKIQLEMPVKCRDHYEKTKSRRAVRQVLAEEGYRW